MRSANRVRQEKFTDNRLNSKRRKLRNFRTERRLTVIKDKERYQAQFFDDAFDCED